MEEIETDLSETTVTVLTDDDPNALKQNNNQLAFFDYNPQISFPPPLKKEDNILKTPGDVATYLRIYETRTQSHYVVLSKDKDFGNIDIVPSLKKMVYWESPRELNIIEFSGRPYMYVGKKILICHYGPDKNKAAKQKYKQTREMEDLTTPSPKKRRVIKGTKKKDCPAKIYCIQVVEFLNMDVQIDENTKALRRSASLKLKELLEKGTAEWRMRFHVVPVNGHQHHPDQQFDDLSVGPLDSYTIDEIVEQTRQEQLVSGDEMGVVLYSRSSKKPWDTGVIKLDREESYTPEMQANFKHAAHAMFYSKSSNKLFGRYMMRYNILMTLRFDGFFGFPGGFIDRNKSGQLEQLEEGLNRELIEEINLDQRYSIQSFEHMHSYVSEDPNLVTHFYVKEISEEDFIEIERGAISAVEWGKETLGIVRVPVHNSRNEKAPLAVFLQNKFVGNAQQELIEALINRKIISETKMAHLYRWGTTEVQILEQPTIISTAT